MKLFVLLLLCAAFTFANDDGCTETGVLISPPPDAGNATITLSLIDSWSVTWAAKALGLDCFEDGSTTYVLGTSNTDMAVRAFDPVTGTGAGTMPLNSANASCFGVAVNNDPDTHTYYTDDWADNVLYYTDDFGSTWSTVPNPAGIAGRGMDFDGTDYWISNSSIGVYRFVPGVGQELFTLAEVPTQISGVTVFPFMGDVGLCVTTYNTYNWYFYQYDGSSLTYLGFAVCPASCTSSYGLAYSDNRGTIFWSYNSGGYRIAEIDFDIDVALERATWAEIKASF
jgi:hypothetical protein